MATRPACLPVARSSATIERMKSTGAGGAVELFSIGHPASILSWLGRTSWLARSAILSETSQRPIAALESVRHEQPRGPLDLSVAGKIELLERRRIRDRRVQRADDPNGSIETLEGLFLNQCRETLTDAAGP